MIIFSVTCSCDKILLENIAIGVLNGAYEKILAVREGKPVYQKATKYLVWSNTINVWYINDDYTSDSYFAQNQVSEEH